MPVAGLLASMDMLLSLLANEPQLAGYEMDPMVSSSAVSSITVNLKASSVSCNKRIWSYSRYNSTTDIFSGTMVVTLAGMLVAVM
jgi:hypothetical protein